MDYGTGSLLPFVGWPWGMNNNWALQTNKLHVRGQEEDRELYVRCTHQASPWIYDFGKFLLTPAVGELKPQWPEKASEYNRTTD